MKYKKHLLSVFAVAVGVSISGATFIPSATAAPQTFSVNVTTDTQDANPGDATCETATPGECSLRAAIEEANANEGTDTIEFTIPGTSTHTIVLSDSLPTISETLNIDGYSQEGSVQNTAVSPLPINAVINIEIDASATTNAALHINGANSLLSGISIYSCPTTCVKVTETDVSLYGNFIGVDATGISTGSVDTQVGLFMSESGHNLSLGGSGPSQRNIVASGNTEMANTIQSFFVNGTIIKGNYIGLGRDGVTDYGSIKNVMFVGSQNSVIGGPATGEANLIAGASEDQINFAFSTNVKVQGNLIGVDSTGSVNPNITSGGGIVASPFSSDSIIGGVNPGEGNQIAGVTGIGIGILSGNSTAFGGFAPADNNAILGNSVRDIGIINYPGFGDSNQGIDLFFYEGDDSGIPVSFLEQGVTFNDDGDVDTGSNSYINFPVLNTAVQDNAGEISINFDLNAIGTPSGDYRVEFYANDTGTIFGHGPGETFIGAVTVEAGDNQDVVFTTPGAIDVTGKSLSATATIIGGTAPSGFGSTSEFSKNILIGSETDFDSDTIADSVEQDGPNGGDANDDGTPDYQQPTVSSFVSVTTGEYISFVTSGCSSNALVTSLAESTLDVADENFTYPFGLTDFILNCSRGDTVTVDKFIFTPEVDVTDFSVRKYHPGTQTFEQVANSTVVSENIGGEHAIHLNYSITDGETGDDDGLANGIIVDPVGLAEVYVASQSVTNPSPGNTTAAGTLAATGQNFDWQTPVILLEIGLLLLFLLKLQSLFKSRAILKKIQSNH